MRARYCVLYLHRVGQSQTTGGGEKKELVCFIKAVVPRTRSEIGCLRRRGSRVFRNISQSHNSMCICLMQILILNQSHG